MRRIVIAAFIAGLLQLAPGVPGAAVAAVLRVHAGPGTPLQDAIDAAAPGDRLIVDGGYYPEAIIVDKPLRIRSPRGARPPFIEIDAGCDRVAGIAIAADHVSLTGISLHGGAAYGIDGGGRSGVELRSVLVTGTCPVSLQGIRVVGAPRFRCRRCTVAGFREAAFFLADLPPANRVEILRSWSYLNGNGILVRDAQPGVLLRGNRVEGSLETGIAVNASAGVRILGNRVARLDSFVADLGIQLDGTSHGNLVQGNHVGGNVLDVSDLGTGNCWRGNTFATGSVPASCQRAIVD